MMRTAKVWLVSGIAASALVVGVAHANHVKIDPFPPQPPPPPMGTSGLVAQDVLQVAEIKAHQVRARTIFANRIDTDQIEGMVHQTGGIQLRQAQSEIKAPAVTASVIYADTISANMVIADSVYVRDLRLK